MKFYCMHCQRVWKIRMMVVAFKGIENLTCQKCNTKLIKVADNDKKS